VGSRPPNSRTRTPVTTSSSTSKLQQKQRKQINPLTHTPPHATNRGGSNLHNKKHQHARPAKDSDGFRHRIACVYVPRKNGKSAVASALAIHDLFFGVKGGECYSIAAEKEQARIVFGEAKKMVEASEELSSMVKLYRDAIELPSRGSVYRVLSAEAYSKEGLNASSVFADEIHAMPDRTLWDVMALSMASRGNKAHMVAVTTAGVRNDITGDDSIAYTLFQYGKRVADGEIDDPTFFMAAWQAPEGADHKDPETWAYSKPWLR
jgi:phage terminase large subunit-like protein